MLLYVLPFVILLIVAIILKKREANAQKTDVTKKSVSSKTKTKPSKQKTEFKAESDGSVASATPTTTALAPELRRHIENQIRDGHYFAAEAQINQALNRDQNQHELYLLLLNLHLTQQDEFAVNQLFNQLSQLQQPEILAQAEHIRQKFEADQAKQLAAQAAQVNANSVSFDQLQEQITSTQADVAPLDFNPTAAKQAVAIPAQPKNNAQDLATPTAQADAPSLDFTVPSQPSTPDASSSLDFNFTAPTQSVDEVDVTAKPSLDFNLEQQITQKKQLDFNLDQTAPVSTTPAALEFKLDLASEHSDNTEATTEPQPLESISVPEFKLDLPESELQPEPKNQFEFSLNHFNDTEVVTTSPDSATTAQLESEDTHADPLLEMFPHLKDTDELELNLVLAEQYIGLGAYAEARSLLAENNDAFNDAQREKASALLNKIAS